MKVSETFLSIQGEGPMQGRPAFFIRLAGCNLRCSFCDTKHAQNPTEAQDISKIREEMLAFSRASGPEFMFVITGGEPLMQQDAVELLLGSYRARHFKIANAWVETNGTIVPSKTLAHRYKANFVVSPKRDHLNTDALKALSKLGAHFKLVVDESGKESWNFEDALKLCKAHDIPNERIWIQPMAKDRQAMIKRTQALWQKCAESSVNLSVRAHIWVHGKKLGV